jgi:surfeit locus 1 family protein
MKPSLLKLTLMAAAGVAMLIALGVWQLQRLEWKQGLIERVETRVDAEPVPLSEVMRRWSQDGDIEYMHVRLSGEFLHGKERHLYTMHEGQPGWRVITTLETPAGAVVMVDRGFVPDDLKAPEERAEGQVEGEVTLTGLARAPGEKGGFTPETDMERNMWYWRDLDGMAASVLSESQRERLVPFFVEAGAGAIPGGWPKGGVTRISFHNRHLEYALTWFGLAAALIGVYVVILWRWRREGEFT